MKATLLTSLNAAENPIEHWMVNTLLTPLSDDPDGLAHLLRDVAVFGCASGAVSELIYTEECVAFYDRFEADIWQIVTDYIHSMGLSLGEFLNSLNIKDGVSFKVKLAWFSVDYSAYRLLNACETEGSVSMSTD